MQDRPKFEKSPPELVDRFAAVMSRIGGSTTSRKMFGYPAAFVNGNLATGLFGGGWFVRLGPERVDSLVAAGETEPFSPMVGRPMKGYAMVPATVVGDDAALQRWVEEAIAFTAGLAPK